MKSYLFALLLFLLLVNKSHSRSLPHFKIPSVSKGAITNWFLHKSIEYIWDKTWNWINQHESPPPPPNAPAEKIEGLSVVKEYLNQFGYIQYSDSFTDYLDQETLQAIQLYQEFLKLDITGQLDNQTLTQISLPRCGVPDLNFTYDLTTTNLSWPKGNHWFPNATSTKVLTYGFLPASEIPTNMTDVFRVAFQRWSEAIGVLNLTEATSFDAADIKVGFYDFLNNSNFQDLLVGDVVIALMNQSGSDVRIVGKMRLDATKYWMLPSSNGTLSWQHENFDLETVAMHQIGHLLGLDHSFAEEAVMYPYILPSQQRKVRLTVEDKVSIQQLYSNTGSGDGGRFTNGWGFLTTLSLGFACMAMLY